MSQLAKLYLRGAISHKIRELSREQRDEIEGIMCDISSDPGLQSAKREFCNALKRTIGNEYMQSDAALSEFNVAVLKAAVAAKYGYGTHDPVEHVLHDAVQRKKWFQTWIFQFLKQILRENKIPAYNESKVIPMSADLAVIQEIKNLLLSKLKEYSDLHDRQAVKTAIKSFHVEPLGSGHIIFVDQWVLPSDIISEINMLSEKYLTLGVEVEQQFDKITIRTLSATIPNVPVRRRRETRIKFSSFEWHRDQSDDSNRYYLEFEASSMKPETEHKDLIENENIRTLRRMLSDDAAKVLDIIIDPPDDYAQQFGSEACRSNISKYLGMRNSEVKKLMHTIKINMMALGITS